MTATENSLTEEVHDLKEQLRLLQMTPTPAQATYSQQQLQVNIPKFSKANPDLWAWLFKGRAPPRHSPPRTRVTATPAHNAAERRRRTAAARRHRRTNATQQQSTDIVAPKSPSSRAPTGSANVAQSLRVSSGAVVVNAQLLENSSRLVHRRLYKAWLFKGRAPPRHSPPRTRVTATPDRGATVRWHSRTPTSLGTASIPQHRKQKRRGLHRKRFVTIGARAGTLQIVQYEENISKPIIKPAMTEPVSIAWLDSVSKEQLVSITQELGIEHTGPTREIRKRIAAWAAKALVDPELNAKFLAMEAAYNEQEVHWRDESQPKTPLTVNQGESALCFF
ncbi:PREDICTED: uncharacterized protein LOC108359169 [Rhagoletis zephyria]|uniref:uncharacterized protein LOC108359169 n=1 Tax=Rhagoletis zephyria TaxID=28612 RepID=UPI0008117D91|nr:PREDICTED: uncharacterized protein LOC108359169 [Rhagoletis zephyria]